MPPPSTIGTLSASATAESTPDPLHNLQRALESADPSARLASTQSETPMTEVTEIMSESEGEGSVFEEYDLGGFTREEVEAYNRMASPGSRLKRKRSVSSAGDSEGADGEEEEDKDGETEEESQETAVVHPPPRTQQEFELHIARISKVFNYLRQHAFYQRAANLEVFFTSQRRAFERNVYDYARALGFRKSMASTFVQKAEGQCRPGAIKHVLKKAPSDSFDEEDVNDSSWEGEIDDSLDILQRLVKEPETTSHEGDLVLPSVEDVEALDAPEDVRPGGDLEEARKSSEADEPEAKVEEKPKSKRLMTEAHKAKRRQKDAEKLSVTAAAEDMSSTIVDSAFGPNKPKTRRAPTHRTTSPPTQTTTPRKTRTRAQAATSPLPTPTPTPRKKKPSAPTTSPYFASPATTTATKSSPKKNISCIPFPPLTSPSFGLVQERLAHDPFRLLIAVIFLNKTRGAVAMPVFYQLIARYPTVQAIADAKHEDIVGFLAHLGLQNARARKIVNLAKTWLTNPPQKGKRYRCLHYPKRDDGKDVKAGEAITDETEDPRVAWEVAHLPGIGAYGFDSWRIFCRDELRGLVEVKEEEGEWTSVLPLDKELRAYLRWRWLRLGWVWDPITGEKERAGEERLREVEEGGVMIEGNDGAVGVGKGDEEGAVRERGEVKLAA